MIPSILFIIIDHDNLYKAHTLSIMSLCSKFTVIYSSQLGLHCIIKNTSVIIHSVCKLVPAIVKSKSC